MDYEQEFLEYVNRIYKWEIFDENNSKYSSEENSFIISINKLIPALIEKMCVARRISIDIHSFCIQEDKVNAFCFSFNKRYYIGINSATYIEILRLTDVFANYLTSDKKWSGLFNLDCKKLQAKLWVNAIRFVIAHEYMHIVLGHCNTLCKEQQFLWEISNDDKIEFEGSFNNIEIQSIELLADIFAAKDAASQILFTSNEIEDIKCQLLIYYLATLLVFSVFEKYRIKDIYHPSLGIRLYAIMNTVDDTFMNLLNVPDSESELEEIDTIIDDFLNIINQFPDFLSIDIVSDMLNDGFDKGFFELYNIASDTVKITNKKADFPIDEFGKMDDTVIDIINNERQILADAVEENRSYQEACEKIRQEKNKFKE